MRGAILGLLLASCESSTGIVLDIPANAAEVIVGAGDGTIVGRVRALPRIQIGTETLSASDGALTILLTDNSGELAGKDVVAVATSVEGVRWQTAPVAFPADGLIVPALDAAPLTTCPHVNVTNSAYDVVELVDSHADCDLDGWPLAADCTDWDEHVFPTLRLATESNCDIVSQCAGEQFTVLQTNAWPNSETGTTFCDCVATNFGEAYCAEATYSVAGDSPGEWRAPYCVVDTDDEQNGLIALPVHLLTALINPPGPRPLRLRLLSSAVADDDMSGSTKNIDIKLVDAAGLTTDEIDETGSLVFFRPDIGAPWPSPSTAMDHADTLLGALLHVTAANGATMATLVHSHMSNASDVGTSYCAYDEQVF